jgi:hypothetical protein
MNATQVTLADREAAEASERRIQRNTWLVIVLTVLAGSIIFGWKMAASTLVGGVLCLLNQRWLSSSVASILGLAAANADGAVPRWTVTKFILRYAVIGTAAGVALWSRKVDLIGFAVGIAAVVWAVIIEAGYQILLTFRNKA